MHNTQHRTIRIPRHINNTQQYNAQCTAMRDNAHRCATMRNHTRQYATIRNATIHDTVLQRAAVQQYNSAQQCASQQYTTKHT
eukprot:1258925-Lingulodinium_polyedra.AAC.1